MNRLIIVAFLVTSSISFSQKENTLWKSASINSNSKKNHKTELPIKHVFDLDLSTLKNKLAKSPKRDAKTASNIIISLPNGEGKFENFRVYENTVMDSELAAKFPEIKSYVAIGIKNPSAKAYFSNSPLGFKSMTLYAGESTVFIEPISSDLKTHTVYKKSDKKDALEKFECSTIDQAEINNLKTNKTGTNTRYAADDGKLRTFRLALSCTAEYASYFGGSKAGALAGMNNTMTRINGIFERDFGLKLILISNNDSVIYTNATTDPYSDYTSKSNWRSELKSNLNTTIGLANYDIGHLLGAAAFGGGGDAGCIGCICSDFNKGAGYTCANPNLYSGDTFDIDYVAHEIGHQLGANHTFTHSTESSSIAQMEPGSGSTIMSYAGVTTKDVQINSDAYFHAISIQQVTNNIKTKTCAVLITTDNLVPVANAGLDYTIPKDTPFMLKGSATDANFNDILTYNWEQIDLGTSNSSVPSSLAIEGPLFRSFPPTNSPTRFFPNIKTILAGLTTTSGLEIPVEVLPNVARSLNFRLTVRDNRANGSASNTDDLIITIDGNSGPFKINSQNTPISYLTGTTQTVNWTVAGTNANGINCATVDILLSIDGGKTFSINLISGTPNNGSANVIIPNIPGTTNRIMVKGTNHIFFDVSNIDFTISSSSLVDIIAPTASTLSVSGITTSSTNLSWTPASDNVGITGYSIYQNGILKTTTTANTLTISGLTASTTYSFYVVAKDATGNTSVASNAVNATTLTPADTIAPSASTLSISGITSSSANLSWTAASDNVGVTGYSVYQNGILKTTIKATSLTISGLTASTTYSFYIVAKDAAGNISAKSNSINLLTLANSINTSLDKSTITYCSSSGNFTDKEYINRIKIGTIDNTSGNNKGYGNFISITTDLVIGISNTITITPTWTRSTLSEAYSLWIDLNQDGDFEDTGERIFSKLKTKAKLVSENFIIPNNASVGFTRMRISMKNNIVPNSCEIFSYGEVEDYTVNITSSTAKPETISEEIILETESVSKDTKSSIKLYPNPVKGDFLNFNNSENYSYFKIFNLIGQEFEKNKIENNSVNVGFLKSGNYFIEFTNDISKITKQFIKE